MATTLGEILQAKGDADYADGGLGGNIAPELYSSAAANQYLQHAADLTYNAHRYLAEQHDQNMRETLKNLNDVDFKNLLPQDSQDLMNQYTGVLQNTANNFGVVRNPLSNPTAYANLKVGESSFRQKLSQAQQDAAFLQKQNEFVQLHPEFNTPDYQNKVKNFLATPVGQRQYFTVNPPLTYNPATAYKVINELAKSKYANAGTNGKYITKEEGEKVDPTKYLQLAQSLPGTDQYGNSLEAARRNAYENLPANIKSQYKDYADFVNKEAALYMTPDQVTNKDVKPDEFATIAAQGKENRRTVGMEEAFQGKQNELNRENALIIAGMKDKNEPRPAEAAEAKLRNLAVIENTGVIDPKVAQALYGDNNQVEQEKIVGIPDNPNDPQDQWTYLNKGKTTLKTKVPATEFVNSWVDQEGNLHMQFKDNVTGKDLPPKVVSHNNLFNDLDGIFGDKFKPKLSSASSEYSKKVFGKDIPTLEDLRNHYKINQSTVPDNVKQTGPQATNTDEINEKLSNPKYEFTTPGGQKVTMDDLKNKYKYSPEQIQNYLTSGILK